MRSVSVGSSTCEYDAYSGWVYLLFFPPVLGSRRSTRGRTLDWNVGENPGDGNLALTCFGSTPLDLIFPN